MMVRMREVGSLLGPFSAIVFKRELLDGSPFVQFPFCPFVHLSIRYSRWLLYSESNSDTWVIVEKFIAVEKATNISQLITAWWGIKWSASITSRP